MIVLKVNCKNSKIQNFVPGRSLGQNDHYFKPYLLRKTLKSLYGPSLCSCFINYDNPKMRVLTAV